MICLPKTRLAVGVLAAALMLLAAGCGGGGGGNGADPEPINSAPTISLVSPSSGSATLDLSSSATLAMQALVNDPDGGEVTLNTTATGGSVSPASKKVAAGETVNVTFTAPDANGVYTVRFAVNDGEATATATATITCTNAPAGSGLNITGISVSPNPVDPGGTATVTATVSNPSGLTLAYKWTSPAGGTITGSGSTATWKAPSTAGSYGIYLKVSSDSESAEASTMAVVSAADSGLLGAYYSTKREKNWVYFNKQLLTRVDANIDFNWDAEGPAPGVVPAEGFAVKWTGYVRIDDAGTYTFRAYVDDGIRMKIKNDSGDWVEAIPNNSENWNDHVEGAWLPVDGETVPLHFDGGKWYPIQIEYFQGGRESFVHLYWSANGGSMKVIPSEYLKAK